MKKLLITFTILLGLTLSSNAQIESLAGPRLGFAFITASPSSGLLNGYLDLGNMGNLPADYTDNIKGAFTTLYGWQWESRFADGGDVTGIVEWIALIGGMESGLFLPSISSMVGARTSKGIEFAMGPNLSLGGIAMVFGAGYNFKSGSLNMPVNIGFVPGRNNTQDASTNYNYTTNQEEITTPEIQYNTGSRFSITLGFNMNR
tara:strand:- start:3346 stop:3954 length:609 start_codon:yes stop_codon:yes gene_type:complete